MGDAQPEIALRDGEGNVLWAGSQEDFHSRKHGIIQAVGAALGEARGGGMPKDDSKMKETEADIHVRERSYRVSAQELAAFVERIEALAQDKAEIQDAIKDIYAEAKARGYDTKCIRKLIAERKRDATDVAEEQAVMDLYREALGR
jgi:uncharacterized protein (UPF0335 family)